MTIKKQFLLFVTLFLSFFLLAEKIKINDIVIRHFVTDRQNRLYEDTDGGIYISADKKGIFKIKFEDFRVK